jgi:vacuolar-type H+-ATPase subunit H
VSITRFDAAEVAAEVEYARELEKQMAKEAREKMREERSEAFKETVSKKSEDLKNWFSHLGKKSNPDIEDHHSIRSQSTV